MRPECFFCAVRFGGRYVCLFGFSSAIWVAWSVWFFLGELGVLECLLGLCELGVFICRVGVVMLPMMMGFIFRFLSRVFGALSR